MATIIRKHLPYLVYSLLSLGILAPLLLPDYILTLDMVFGPSTGYTDRFYGLEEWSVTASAPFWLLFQWTDNVLPMWVLEKIILFFIIFLAGLGAHRLLPSKGAGNYFAGVLYMINPFTYVRFLAGQWGVLGAYALMPFAIKAFLNLLEKGGAKQAIKVALLSTLIGIFQIHGFFLLFIVFLIILLVKVIKERKDHVVLARLGKSVAIAAGAFLALNLYWLLPALTAGGTLEEQISRKDLLFFAPNPTSSMGIMFDLSAMYGFWRGGYTYVKDLLPVWWLVFAFIFYLAACGFIYKLRDSKIGWAVCSFGLLWLVGLIFAAGYAIDFTRPPFEWLFDHLIIFRGFRDSHKFVALLCLSYSFLGGLGVNQFIRWWKDYENERYKIHRKIVMAIVSLALIAPFAYSYTIFGFYGQLKATDYPQDWYEANDYINQDEEDFNVLFLPWHMYMDFDWLSNEDKRLANPARHFFDKPTISGDNIEAGDIYSQSTNPVSKYVEFLLDRGDEIANLGELLAPLNVRYVILVHESDYESYHYLYQQNDLAVELEKDNLTLFRNQHGTARAYAVDSIIHIESLDEYLDLSLEQDVMHHLYVLGEEVSETDVTGMQALEVIQKTRTKYKIEGSEKRWVVFTVPQRVSTEDWNYGDGESAKNLGFMPAFEASDEEETITYSRFYNIYLPGYIISLIAFIVCLACLLIFPRLLSRQERLSLK